MWHYNNANQRSKRYLTGRQLAVADYCKSSSWVLLTRFYAGVNKCSGIFAVFLL
jgi:hypothetical protein